ncbi:MAG: DNRLRE domain-containing protein, partial [Planctomycetota bacterium]
DQSNHGNDLYLYSGYDYNAERTSYIQFDISSIPASATVASAELWIYVIDSWNTIDSNFIFAVREAADAWNEFTITWENAPLAATITTFIGPANGYTGWIKISGSGLTATIQNWISYPLFNNGISIVPLWGLPSNDELTFESKESFSSNTPKLFVRYTY